MIKETFRRPDEQVMNHVLTKNHKSIVEIVLRLAWNMGLTAKEICGLKWSDVSFADKQIHLPGRSLPIADEMLPGLEFHYKRAIIYKSEYVVSSDRNHTQMNRVSIAALVRKTLDEGGLADITLTDLRDDFILRQLEQHDWPYVARISGIAILSAQKRYGSQQQPKEKKGESTEKRPVVMNEACLLTLAQNGSAEGLAIWMGWKLGMRLSDIVELTWKQIDMENRCIFVPAQTLDMDDVLYQQLRRLQAERNPEQDEYVVLTPRSKRPFSLERLSVAIKNMLFREGMEGMTFLDLITLSQMERQQPKLEKADAILMGYAEQHGNISKRKGAELLQGTDMSAYNQLQNLAKNGKLVHVGEVYYIPGTVVPPEEHYEVVCAYLQENGPSFLKELTDLLRLTGRQAQWILLGFVKEGRLIKKGKRYALPAETIEST